MISGKSIRLPALPQVRPDWPDVSPESLVEGEFPRILAIRLAVSHTLHFLRPCTLAITSGKLIGSSVRPAVSQAKFSQARYSQVTGLLPTLHPTPFLVILPNVSFCAVFNFLPVWVRAAF